MQVLNQIVEVGGIPYPEYVYEADEPEIALTCGSCRHFENRGRVSVCRVTQEWDDYMRLTLCKQIAGCDPACPKYESVSITDGEWDEWDEF